MLNANLISCRRRLIIVKQSISVSEHDTRNEVKFMLEINGEEKSVAKEKGKPPSETRHEYSP